MHKERIILHVDMDAFFAAIEQHDNPKLRTKPVVIGANPKGGRGRGVVSTCSYEARKFGIHSAMPISIAYKKCPQAVFLPVDMNKYASVSDEVYRIFYDFTPVIEPVSIDEAFLDMTASYHIFGSARQAAIMIKSRVKKETGLTASIGIGPNKMVAKIASDLDKPDGLVEVNKEQLLDFLWPLNIDKIWGLGKKTKEVMDEFGISTIGDLAKKKPEQLSDILGKNGIYFWQLAHGIDDREVESDTETKSISNEVTFDKDTSDMKKIESVLVFLCEKVSHRLRKDDFKGRTITLKIRLQDFHTFTRAVTLSRATNFVDVIYKEIKKLYLGFDKKNKKVRLLGVKVSNLVETDFPDTLFDDGIDSKLENIHRAVDKIKEKFGDGFIKRAADRSPNI